MPDLKTANITDRSSRTKRSASLEPDDIFQNQDFVATSAYTLEDAGGSDHFLIVATLSLVK